MNRYYVLPVSLATRRGTAYQVRDRQSGAVRYSSRVERDAVERCNTMNESVFAPDDAAHHNQER